MTEAGKDNTPSGRPKPKLIRVGNHEVIDTGKWNNDLVADHIQSYAADEWLEIGKLARVIGGNNIANKKLVRSRLAQVCVVIQSRGKFLCIEYGGKHGAASSVKIADLKSAEDRQNVLRRLEKQRKRKELTEEQYLSSVALLNATDPYHDRDEG